MSNAWAGGSTAAWRKLRGSILQANRVEHGGACQVALPDVCTGQANTVHHTLGKKITGDDPKYLVACCKECNGSIGEPARAPRHKRVSNW